MVEDILTAASADQNGLSISMTTVNAVAEIESVLGPLRATGAKIASNLEAANITTDALRFRQVIRNLVSNALRHGGPNNLVAGRIDDGFYTVQVRDDGPGIPEALEDRLFTRFIHQGNEPLLTGSVGLGLAIAQLLTTRTGGTISYRRDQGETVFSVRYPLAAPKPAELPYSPVAPPDAEELPASTDIETSDDPRRDAESEPAVSGREAPTSALRASDSDTEDITADDPAATAPPNEVVDAEPIGRPYVYKRPRWKDREPADKSGQPPPGRPEQPDLIITFTASESADAADEAEQELLDESF
jgi:anti-sigma regulatory factor (Ser/Thr protein kinase)